MAAFALRFGMNGPITAPAVSSNDGRVQFLKDFGWDVTTSPVESSQVKIPETSGEVFDRYNALQKTQGYDLSKYAGKSVMRYVYKVNNYPNATEPVYATLLVYKNQIIGGDVTNTSAQGKIHGFQTSPATASEPSAAAVSEPSAATTAPSSATTAPAATTVPATTAAS